LNLLTGIKLLYNIIGKGLNRRPINSCTEIRLTRLCTQRCRQCSIYEKTDTPPYMSVAQFKILAKKLRDYGAYIGFISGGEPTLVPHLEEILLEARNTFPLSTVLVTGLINKTDTIQRIGRTALENDINIQTSLDGLGGLGDFLRGTREFSKTVLRHMEWLSSHRGNSKSLLYANLVINNLNIHQVPELVKRANDIGWKTTVGLYHSITSTTRYDKELKLKPGKDIDDLLLFLEDNPDILNLNSFINGINNFIQGVPSGICAFLDAPMLATRSTIMENGDVHLCKGKPIGNIFRHSLNEIFSGKAYLNRLEEYRSCNGCWTTCYTQRYLLVHPGSIKEFIDNIQKVRALKN